mgnify:CR=1 FL=1|jgi:hypothetical protein
MATKSDDSWVVWLVVIGFGLWWAYNSWWDKEKPASPAPLPAISPRPTGLIRVGENDSGTVRYLEANSVRGDRAHRRGWIISDHSKDRTVAQRETKQLVRANCDEGSYTIPSYVMYDKDGGVITTWDESEDDKARVFHAVPGSIGESNFEAVCDARFDPFLIPPPITAK